jgi:hypothetical protein
MMFSDARDEQRDQDVVTAAPSPARADKRSSSKLQQHSIIVWCWTLLGMLGKLQCPVYPGDSDAAAIVPGPPDHHKLMGPRCAI